MTRTIIFGISIFITILFIGCGTSNPILATIGDEKLSLHEFEDNYAKNNGGWDTSATSTLEDRQKFLDLILKFKLKVKEARARGLEKDSAIVSELESYNVSVGQSYMNEKEVIQPGVQQLYDRKKEEVRASHILFRISPGAKPADTLAKYEQALKVISQLQKNIPFDTLAVQFSEDPSVKTNHGDLGFFSSGKTVPEFEDACYSMKVGEYTKAPIRTQFGYHVLKVTGKQINPGSVRISHILLRFNKEQTDTIAVRDTVWMIYNRIKNGEKFEDLMKTFSQDEASKANNGDIGTYERDRLPPNIAEVFYKMKVGEVSEPIRFNYGFHIFKLTEKKAILPIADIYNDLKNQHQQARYKYENQNYTQGLITKYHPIVDTINVNRFISVLDSTKTAEPENWKDSVSANILELPLVKLNTGRKFNVNDFAEKVINLNENKKTTFTPANIWTLITKLVNVAVTEEHARFARDRHPVLASLMNEYKAGVLLYRIEQDEVWKRVVVNDSVLKEYYNEHKENYWWPERVNFAEIYTVADSMANAAYWRIKYGEDFTDVAKEFTNRSGYREKGGEWGLQQVTLNELSKKAAEMAIDSVTAPFRYEQGWSILKKISTDSAHIKTFEEATPEVASGYQEFASKKREQEWIKELESKYPITIQKEVLKESFKRKRVGSE